MISTPARANTPVDTVAGAIPFVVSDLETPPANLTVTGYSANALLLPNRAANIALGGAGSNRTVTLTPAPGQTGVAPMTLVVSDGTNSASSVFPLLVVPSAQVLLYDPFDYADGPLDTNSAFLWSHHSGTAGDCLVTNGQMRLSGAQTEDVAASLIGAPYSKTNGGTLYASFRVRFLSLPKAAPEYFAAFLGGSSYRGRVYAGTTNSAAGRFGLFVANATDAAAVPVAVNLATNTSYTVVARYDISASATTLWVNPESEADPGTSAADAQDAISISSYAFRQDSGLGATLLIDDVRVGLSFAAAASAATSLSIERNGRYVVLRWTDGSSLQAASSLTGVFTDLSNAASPYTNLLTGPARFFRLAKCAPP